MQLDMSYHQEQKYIWIRGEDLTVSEILGLVGFLATSLYINKSLRAGDPLGWVGRIYVRDQ